MKIDQDQGIYQFLFHILDEIIYKHNYWLNRLKYYLQYINKSLYINKYHIVLWNL